MANETVHTTHTTGKEPVHTYTTSTSSGGSTGFIVGAAVVILAIIAALFLFGGGDDMDEGTTVNIEAAPAAGEAAPTTEVIEPGVADGGAATAITTEPNEAGTAADPALGGGAATETTGN